MNNNKLEELSRLRIEDYIWVCFIILNILNIVANDKQRKFVISNNSSYESEAREIYLFIIIVTIIVYIYFLNRNYQDYMNNLRKPFMVRYVGSIFFMVGILCLLYFQISVKNDFIGGVEV